MKVKYITNVIDLYRALTSADIALSRFEEIDADIPRQRFELSLLKDKMMTLCTDGDIEIRIKKLRKTNINTTTGN